WPVQHGLDAAHRLARDVASGLERHLAVEVHRAQDVARSLLGPDGIQRADRVQLSLTHACDRVGESGTGGEEGNGHNITCFRAGSRFVVLAAQWARLAASTGVSSPSFVDDFQRHAPDVPAALRSETATDESSAP